MDQNLQTLVPSPPPPMFILGPTEPKFPVTKNVPQSGISHLPVRFSFFHIYKSAFCHLCHMLPTAPYGPYLLSPWPQLIFLVSTAKNLTGGLPWCLVVKNPPANAGDAGSIPDWGRSHMPYGNQACVPKLPSLCSRAREPQPWNTRTTITVAPHPRVRVPHGRKLSVDPACATTGSPHTVLKSRHSQKEINEI